MSELRGGTTTAPGCWRAFLALIVFFELGGGVVVVTFDAGWPLGVVLFSLVLFVLPVLILYWVAGRQLGFVLYGVPLAGIVICLLLVGWAALIMPRSALQVIH